MERLPSSTRPHASQPSSSTLPPLKKLKRSLTPRQQFIENSESYFYDRNIPQEVIKHYLERARNSHENFLKNLQTKYPDDNITVEETYLAAFPRFHKWTIDQNLIQKSAEECARETPVTNERMTEILNICPQDLGQRILYSRLKDKKLWQLRQEYIAKQSLKFLLKSKIMHENTDVIADLLCETGSFLKRIHHEEEKNMIEYNTAYGIDIDTMMIEIAEQWGMPHTIYQADIKDIKENDIPKADFIYISAPVIVFENQEKANNMFRGIHQYAKEDSKIFLGLSCSAVLSMLDLDYPTTKTFMSGIKKYFDYELITSQNAQENGWCEKDRLIADTYGGAFILTPKPQEASSSQRENNVL